MLPSNPVESQLLAELDRARVESREANIGFRKIIAAIPSGIPHPDGSRLVRIAGERCRRALEAFVEAQREYSAFAATGEIPKRLKPEGGDAGS